MTNKIDDIITKAPEEVKKNNRIIEERYSFKDVVESIEKSMEENSIYGYRTYFKFPNLFRVYRGTKTHIVAEFSPDSVKFNTVDFKEMILNSKYTKRFKKYLMQEVSLKRVEL